MFCLWIESFFCVHVFFIFVLWIFAHYPECCPEVFPSPFTSFVLSIHWLLLLVYHRKLLDKPFLLLLLLLLLFSFLFNYVRNCYSHIIYIYETRSLAYRVFFILSFWSHIQIRGWNGGGVRVCNFRPQSMQPTLRLYKHPCSVVILAKLWKSPKGQRSSQMNVDVVKVRLSCDYRIWKSYIYDCQ